MHFAAGRRKSYKPNIIGFFRPWAGEPVYIKNMREVRRKIGEKFTHKCNCKSWAVPIKRKEEEYEEDEEDFSHAFGSGDGHGDERDRVGN